MEFRTERLILRPWKESDAESLYKYAKDPRVGPVAGFPVHTSIENSLEIIKNVLSAPEIYAVCLKEDNIAIGSIGLMPSTQSQTQSKNDEVEIGYWIGVPFWGNGYIPEAVREMQKHAFIDLGYKAIWCGYYDGNEKSKRCQEKCGFIYHHTEKDIPCIHMKDIRTEHFTYLTKEQWENCEKALKRKAVLYIHGKGGSATEAEHYNSLFPECDVFGFDYKANSPWEAKEEFSEEYAKLKSRFNSIIIIANSIGAFFTMSALSDKEIERYYFISPIVNMEKLITDMMNWAGVSEKELEKRREISTDSGETLSWEYLCYVRKNSIVWNSTTYILYGENDNLTSYETISEFSKKANADLTVMKNGEHWFHTSEQTEFLDKWIKSRENSTELNNAV